MHFLEVPNLQVATCIYNHVQMKGRSNVLLVVLIVSVLFFVIGFLFVENRFYKNKNQELLLQNDSVISANIELKNSIDSMSKPVADDKRKFKTISNK